MQLDNKYLLEFEEKLKLILLEKTVSAGFSDGQLIEIEELDELWADIATEYIADSISLLDEYPSVAFAWAGYLGFAMASIWDGAWNDYKGKDFKNLYTQIRDKRGYDNMDEYIMEKMLGIELESEENQKLENLLRSLAQTAISQIQKEQIQSGTKEAFYIFALSTKQIFKAGVSIMLREFGYKYVKSDVVS